MFYGTPPLSAHAWLILPTYNEAENLEGIVRAVLPWLERAAGEDGFRILVVDDNSPDGTGRIADLLCEEVDCLRVLHRPAKQGLGPAYVAGFRYALDQGAVDVIEMDADFSHDPAYLPGLIGTARDGADLVLGSRYIEGGGVENWHWLRKLISRGGCWYARLILRVDVRDLTGGFKCFRAEALQAIDFETVGASGYAFQIEMTYRALRRGLRVVEIPIVFKERREGRSKMSRAVAWEAVKLVPRIRRSA